MTEKEKELYLGLTVTIPQMRYYLGINRTHYYHKDWIVCRLLHNKYQYRKSDELMFETKKVKVKGKIKEILTLSKEFHNITMKRKKLRHKACSIVATNIKNAIQSHGITINKIAKSLRISTPHFHMLLNGTLAISCSEIDAISKYLKMPIEWFFVDHSLEYNVTDNSTL